MPPPPEHHRTLSLVLVDDHPLMREGLRGLLEDEPDVTVAAAFSEAESALREWPRDIDLAMIDLALGAGMRGTDLIRELAGRAPATRFVLLTMFDDPRIEVEAREAGAHAYLLKQESPDRVLEVVRKVAGGDTFIGPGPPLSPSGAAGAPSPRELAVLRAFAAGRSAKQVAEDLGLSIHTVDTYRRRLAEKLGARSIADLVRAAARLGLVDIGRPARD